MSFTVKDGAQVLPCNNSRRIASAVGSVTMELLQQHITADSLHVFHCNQTGAHGDTAGPQLFLVERSINAQCRRPKACVLQHLTMKCAMTVLP